MLDAIRDLGAGLSRFTERWIPDSFLVASACFVVSALAMWLIPANL